MDSCERQVDITVLVVDDDTTTLSIIASILRSWEYKVVTAINAQDALKTLREFSGFFDLVITDLNMPSMNGFELLKLVKEEFQLPVIMMSADTRKSVMSKSLAKGAAFYIVKPVCRDDFKDIWQYAVAGRKEKFVAENELMGSEVGESSGEKITSLQDVNSAAPSPVAEPKRRGRYGKRKGGQLNKEDLSEGSSGAPKKPKVVWTNSLHNQFLLAIRQIGLNKAVPKRILEIMNVPGLTRENVASHLQKYRIFLRKVAERGILEGLTDRALRSSFASGLPTSLIKDIQRRILNMRLPLQHQPQPHLRTPPQYSSTLPQPSTPLNDLPQFPSLHCPNPSNTNHVPQNHHQAFNTNSLNQVRLGSNFHHPVSTKAVFPAYGSGGNGFMTSANGLTGGITMNYGGASMHNNNNYGSLGNSSSFNYSGSPGNSGNQLVPFGRSNYYGIQLNGGSLMAGMDQRRLNSDNSFGLINGTTPNAVSNGNYGLSQGWDASAAAGNVLPSTLNMSKSTLENVSGLLPLPQQLNDNLGNAGDHGHDQNNVNPVSTEDEACQFDENLTELFLMLDDMHLLKEREDNPNDVSEFWNSDFPNSFHAEQLLEQQSQGGTGDVSAPSTESSINLPNKSPTPSDENPNKLLGNDGFADLDSFDMYLVDKANSSASISQAAVQDWDMDLIESLFGSEAPN